MQEEVTNKTVTLVIHATKLTARVLLSAINSYLKQHEQKKTQKKNIKMQQKAAKMNRPKQGKISVKELASQNAGMTNIEIDNRNIKSFERYARCYGINFAVKKDKSKDPPVYMVFFKGRDQDAIHAAFRDFSTAQIKKANKNTIRKRLQKYRAMVAQNKRSKIRQKVQDQSL
ncbi:MAG: PcfB family protein [Eubacteriales bacterium]|nr:PcfB family protein [Eubacteriales bacterium]